MVKRQHLTSNSDSNTSNDGTSRHQVTNVTDHMRLTLILLITEFGLSCYLAAKVLKIPYTNAKVIYRVYKKEDRVVQNSRSPLGNHNFIPSQQKLLSSSLDTSRSLGKTKLSEALQTSLFTAAQKQRIYQQNFDELISKPSIEVLHRDGWSFLG